MPSAQGQLTGLEMRPFIWQPCDLGLALWRWPYTIRMTVDEASNSLGPTDLYKKVFGGTSRALPGHTLRLHHPNGD